MVLRRFLGLTAVAIAMSGGSAFAQTVDENRDADALAADMRILAQNPLDIEALITAGELTLKLGDNSAAAGFFTRAEKLDPLNPRIKAGRAALLVRAERPGEALRLFQAAEARGLDPRKFAADRGLAYDLIGEQERAQRDYRLVLRTGPNDEVTRRYALSLGISGRKKEAFDLLDPLLRRSDRAAWRDRAFVLAMSGDISGAQHIADTMMSPGLGRGLAPFFERLPKLSAVDRAFAVTFGEMRATPERVLDARQTPALPQLGPDPYAPRALAAADEPVKLRFAEDDDGKKKKKKRKGDALAPPVPAPPPPVEVALSPPVYVPPRSVPAPVYVQPLPVPKPAPRVVMTMPPASRPTPAPVTVPKPAPLPPPVVVVASPPPPPILAPEPPRPILAPPVPPPPPPAPAAVATTDDPIAPVADQPSAAEAGVAPTATSRVSEDTVLAKIIEGISVPGSELGVAPMPAKAPPPPPVPKPVELSKPVAKARPVKPEPVIADAAAKPTRGTRGKPDPALTKGKSEPDEPKGKGREDAVALDRNGCPIPPKTARGKPAPAATSKAKTTARGKADARGKTNDKCKTDPRDDKKAGDVATKGEPARIWVQVAGGANEASLQNAWAGLREKAPDLFRNRQGWTTPLRNTNRVLAGPFKSADEAQDFVNRMAKAGLKGFVFSSAKGQKIDRLGAK